MAALREEPTPRSLRHALYRAIIAAGDEFTRRVAERCEDREYAPAFGKAILQSVNRRPLSATDRRFGVRHETRVRPVRKQGVRPLGNHAFGSDESLLTATSLPRPR
jgi:hypothetical protein